MKCNFSKSTNKDKGIVRLEAQEIPKSENCQYLGSLIHKN